MKNITLAIDERLVEAARAVAVRRGTTLNAMVRQLLEREVNENRRIKEAKAALKRLMDSSTARVGPDYKWNREELYADRLFPGHKRPSVRRGRKAG